MANVLYSPLSTVLTVSQLPDKLSFISSGLNSLLANLYYRNLRATRSLINSSVRYELDLISFTEILKLEIPGTGLVLTLNPDLQASGANPAPPFSIIPITFTWRWDILEYVLGFKNNGFAFTPTAFFKILLQIVNKSDEELFIHILDVSLDQLEYEEDDLDLGEDEPPATTPDPIPQVFIPSYDYDPEPNADYQQDFELWQLETFITDAKLKYPTLTLPQPLNNNTQIAYADINTALNLINIDVYSALFELYIIDPNNSDITEQRVNQIFSDFIDIDPIEFVKQLLIPKITASAQLSAGLEIPRTVLPPVNQNNEVIAGEIKTKLIFSASEFYFNAKQGFGFNDNLTINFHPDTPKAQIANTGLIIGFTQAKLDVNTKANIPEADLAGYPPDFVGLYIQQASITFARFGITDPTKASTTLFAKDVLIGTGGISGTIGLAANGTLHRKFGKFEAELKLFSLTFRQGSIVQCNIEGTLTIPGFIPKSGSGNAIIGIQARIFDNGDFSITAKPLAVLPPISLFNVFDLTVRSLEVGKLNNIYYAELSCILDFTANLPILGNILPKQIEIHRLRIWGDGHLEFAAGRIKLQKAFKLEVGPVKLEVVELTLAPYKKGNRNYSSITFDGMINTGRAGVSVGGNGIKYYFSTDGQPFDHFLRIEGIDIDIRVPGDKTKDANFLLKGHLSMKNPDPQVIDSPASNEYTGSVTFDIPKLDFGGSAGMRLNPSIPAYVVDMGVELATPIPIGATGLGIYGFRGLFGQHYVPSKADGTTWLEYYRAPVKGVNIKKFASKPGLSLGAGASIATSFDSGKTFSSKLFLLLGLPEVFLLEGQAAVLRKRLGLDDDVEPPFTALIIIGDQSTAVVRVPRPTIFRH